MITGRPNFNVREDSCKNRFNCEKRKKLIKVISHDVERIERLITDYSQMLKDEAALSRAKMTKIDLSNVVNSVVEDFNSNLFNSNKNIKIIPITLIVS